MVKMAWALLQSSLPQISKHSLDSGVWEGVVDTIGGGGGGGGRSGGGRGEENCKLRVYNSTPPPVNALARPYGNYARIECAVSTQFGMGKELICMKFPNLAVLSFIAA